MEYENSQMSALIDEHIHSDRDAAILRLRLIHGHTYERIAEEIDPPLSTRQVYRIVSRGAAKLYPHLNAVDKNAKNP